MRLFISVVAFVAALTSAAVAWASPADITSADQALSAETFTVELAGPGGTGTAELTLNPSGKVCYVLDVTLTTADDFPEEPGLGIGNAHIHTEGTGGIAVPLDATFTSLGDGRFVSADCVRADKEQVREILANPENFYINIHTHAFPAGAVTGALAT